jgi:hypothetical protein
MDIFATVYENEVTSDGEIATGFLSASIKNIGAITAEVNGVPLPAGEAKSYCFVGKPYQAVAYQTFGTTLLIMRVI